ncbi:hypothetical protein CEE37_14945 [candidate division LCP-89 bacterium B3_LCP]|uniref:Nitrate reductase n=1 Tax=candidate division LCP-89 bacterium B3_LCP TaxID=2012998 RepID=A0A532UNP9_UNCL8|nr:MAG: hypothetical protein CEE37_14945 [candidate division LCP-89 bacterium B3_LCP]
MQAWIEFGQGPLFRLCFVLMILGLIRIFILTIIGMVEALNRNTDKIVPYRDLIQKTLMWLFPIKHLWTKRPFYGLISVLFHVGLLIVPLFLAAHVLMWKNSVGFAWFSIPRGLADWLTIIVIVTGIVLFLMRASSKAGRALSRKQDYIWPLLLVVPFITGYICSNSAIGPAAYQLMMMVHVYSANLIMLMIPFTKIAHCILVPLSQLVTAISWKFPAGAGDMVIETLGYKEYPTWVKKPRLETPVELKVKEEINAE